jgi:hypothetical protein
MRKFIALFLVFSLAGLTGNLYAKKKGVNLIVQKKDGQLVRGELIAVKENSLLLKEKESGADLSVDIEDVNVIKIMKKSKTLLGAGLGFLTGVSVGALGTGIGWELGSWAPNDTKTKFRIMAWVGTISGLVGAVVGRYIGAHTNRSETIQIEGLYQGSIEFVLKELRKEARIRDYQ